jgi:excisionase family DNA binding protein
MTLATVARDLIVQAEAARILRCSERYVRKLVHRGDLRTFKPNQKHCLLWRGEVEELAARRKAEKR